MLGITWASEIGSVEQVSMSSAHAEGFITSESVGTFPGSKSSQRLGSMGTHTRPETAAHEECLRLKIKAESSPRGLKKYHI